MKASEIHPNQTLYSIYDQRVEDVFVIHTKNIKSGTVFVCSRRIHNGEYEQDIHLLFPNRQDAERFLKQKN